MREKPKVGQILYSLNVGNAARWSESKLTEVVVKKVGRKYFSCGKEGCSDRMNTQYHLSNWRENTKYCEGSKLYTSREEWEYEKLEDELCRKFKNAFEYGHNKLQLPLVDLVKIDRILDES